MLQNLDIIDKSKYKNNKMLYSHFSFITLIYILMNIVPNSIYKYLYLCKNDLNKKTSISFILNNYTHQDFDHYLSNSILMLIIGGVVRSKISENQFFFIFLLGGIASNIIPFYRYPDSVQIGSSGSIYSLIGANLASEISQNKISIIGVNSIILFLTDIIGFVNQDCSKEESCTLHSSHLSGAILGFMLTFFLKRKK